MRIKISDVDFKLELRDDDDKILCASDPHNNVQNAINAIHQFNEEILAGSMDMNTYNIYSNDCIKMERDFNNYFASKNFMLI